MPLPAIPVTFKVSSKNPPQLIPPRLTVPRKLRLPEQNRTTAPRRDCAGYGISRSSRQEVSADQVIREVQMRKSVIRKSAVVAIAYTTRLTFFFTGVLVSATLILPQAALALPPQPADCAGAYSQCTGACGPNPNFTTGDNIPSYSDWLSCNSSCSSDQAKCNTTPIQHPVSPPCGSGKQANGGCQNAPVPIKTPPTAKCKGAACNVAPLGSNPQQAK